MRALWRGKTLYKSFLSKCGKVFRLFYIFSLHSSFIEEQIMYLVSGLSFITKRWCITIRKSDFLKNPNSYSVNDTLARYDIDHYNSQFIKKKSFPFYPSFFELNRIRRMCCGKCTKQLKPIAIDFCFVVGLWCLLLSFRKLTSEPCIFFLLHYRLLLKTWHVWVISLFFFF